MAAIKRNLTLLLIFILLYEHLDASEKVRPSYSAPLLNQGILYIGTYDSAVAVDTIKASVLWRTNTGWIDSYFAFASHSVIASTMDGRVFALNSTSGQVEWSQRINSRLSSPSIMGKDVLISSLDSVLQLSLGSGDRLWSKHIEELSSHMPVSKDSIIYLSLLRKLIAMEYPSGKYLWSFSLPKSRFSTSLEIVGDKCFIATPETVYCLDRKTGLLVWQFDYPFFKIQTARISGNSEEAGDVLTKIAHDAERVFVGSKVVYALKQSSGEILWTKSLVDTQRVVAPSVFDGLIYWPSYPRLIAISAESGRTIWSCDTGLAGDGFLSEPAASRDAVFFTDGRFLLFSVSVNSGKIEWKVSLRR